MRSHCQQSTLRKILCALFLVMFFPSVGLGQVPSADVEMDYRIPSGEAGNPVGLLSTNSFVDWYRYPAEERTWLRMANATSYFRDVVAGGETLIYGAVDGEVWNADAQLPDGSTRTWPDLKFYSTYGGSQNCFVSPWWVICNTTSLYVLWYTNAQCQPTGTWTMSFYNNGARFYSGNFTHLPQIPPAKVPLYNQGAYSNAYDTICRTGTQRNVYTCDGRANEVPWTIAGKGCALTSASMVLGYHGVSVDPPVLNTWLINNRGYDRLGNIYWDAVSRYARSAGRAVSYLGAGGDLERAICTYGPHIISVRGGGHWVSATGRDADKTTYLINDPNGGVSTTLAARYGNVFGAIRRYGGPEYIYTDMTGIVIRFHSPGELLITNPEGQLTGLDPLTGRSYNEIPGSAYSVIGLEDDESGDPGPDTKEIDIRQPIAGEYTLKVTGTGEGTYDLEINAYDPNQNPSQKTFVGIPISNGAVHSYGFQYAKAVDSDIEISGGFDGGGQRPKDVNKFLSYISPAESQTTLPAGTTIFELRIAYGKPIIPTTFTATLNGADVGYLFTPTPSTIQAVSLPLQPGRNVLVLSVEGNLPNRVATDTDRLVFIVP